MQCHHGPGFECHLHISSVWHLREDIIECWASIRHDCICYLHDIDVNTLSLLIILSLI
jgi:hypothetical protein